MGSYQCGYCRERGHNQSTCPTLKSNYEAAKKALASGSSQWELSYRERMALSRYPRIVKNKKQGRRCSYCQEGGHRVTTCAARKSHIAQFEQLRTIWQEQVTRVLKKHGVGQGAIVTEKVWKSVNNAYEKVLQPFMVVSLNPDCLSIIDFLRYVSHSANPYRMLCVPLDDPTSKRSVMVPYPALNELSELLVEQVQDDDLRFNKWQGYDEEDVLIAPSTASVVAPAMTKAMRKNLFKGETIGGGRSIGRVYRALVRNGGTFFGRKLT